MQLGELIISLHNNLQSLCRNSVLLKNASFQQVMGIIALDLDGMEMSSFSFKIGVDNSTATRLVSRLEKRGWVVRKKDKFDKRIVIVSLTEEGKIIQNDLEIQFDKLGKEIKKKILLQKDESILESVNTLNWILMKIKMETNNIVICK